MNSKTIINMFFAIFCVVLPEGAPFTPLPLPLLLPLVAATQSDAVLRTIPARQVIPEAAIGEGSNDIDYSEVAAGSWGILRQACPLESSAKKTLVRTALSRAHDRGRALLQVKRAFTEEERSMLELQRAFSLMLHIDPHHDFGVPRACAPASESRERQREVREDPGTAGAVL